MKVMCTVSIPNFSKIKAHKGPWRINGAFGNTSEIDQLLKLCWGVHIQVDLPMGRIKPKTNNMESSVLLSLAHQNDVPAIGISYVNSQEDVRGIKAQCEAMGYSPKFVAKIETRGAVQNMQSIVDIADQVLIDREDLSAAVGRVEMTRVQKLLGDMCADQSKEYMVSSRKWDEGRVEVALYSRATCLVISKETAVDKEPHLALQNVQKWIQEVERPVC